MRLQKEVETWFNVPKDPDKARLKIRYLNAGEKQVILQDVNDVSYLIREEDGQEKGEGQVKQNGVRLREEMVDARIVEWENMLDEKGDKLECNRENKLKFSCLDQFMTVFNKLVTELEKKVEADLKKEVKNSKSSQDG